MSAILLSVVLAIGSGCKKDTPENPGNNGGGNNSGGNTTNDVRVTTYTPQSITQTTAVCGGDVIVTEGLTLTEIGVCWSTERNPTPEGLHMSTENWNEPFVYTLTGLEPSTKYYVRAYALRGIEYYYGAEKNFTTEAGGGVVGNPTIEIMQGEDFIQEGDILDLDVDYQYGFRMVSNSQTMMELATLKLEFKLFDMEDIELFSIDTTLFISGTEYVYQDVIQFSMRELVGKVSFTGTVTDVGGNSASTTFDVFINQLNQPAYPLEVMAFEWYRLGATATGLEEFGLYWHSNIMRDIYAKLVPLDGVKLFIFNSEKWDEVTTDVEKAALFLEAIETQQTADEYTNVNVSMASMSYDDVIGTVMPDGTCHLIHVTRSYSEYVGPQGISITITGEAK